MNVGKMRNKELGKEINESLKRECGETYSDSCDNDFCEMAFQEKLIRQIYKRAKLGADFSGFEVEESDKARELAKRFGVEEGYCWVFADGWC